jgi:hypothetical protein
MEDIIDLIATNSSASSINDAIKATLYNKAAEKIDEIRPLVSSSMFGSSEESSEIDDEDYSEEE